MINMKRRACGTEKGMEMDIKFQEPPPRRGGGKAKYVTSEVVRALDARPGEWALVVENGNSSAKNAAFQYVRDHAEYEVTVRSTQEQRFDVYMRRVA